jgi:hypothetical protein
MGELYNRMFLPVRTRTSTLAEKYGFLSYICNPSIVTKKEVSTAGAPASQEDATVLDCQVFAQVF